jgi:thymidylate synthase
MWGWSGINAFEWSVLQEIVAKILGNRVGALTFNIGSLHLYQQHWDKARKIRDLNKSGVSIPFDPDNEIEKLYEVDLLLDRWFKWEDLCRRGEATLKILETWHEPMFKAWALAIAYYWMRGDEWLTDLQGTALAVAIAQTPTSVLPEPVQRPTSVPVAPTPTPMLTENVRAFYEFVSDLHAKKHASYGDSWKKRGEKLSILANIARKVDRLGVGDEYDSAADTWIDLMVYLAKYLCWIDGVEANPDRVNLLIDAALHETQKIAPTGIYIQTEIEGITRVFDTYADGVDKILEYDKRAFVRTLLARVTPIARDVWINEQPVNEYRGADLD